MRVKKFKIRRKKRQPATITGVAKVAEQPNAELNLGARPPVEISQASRPWSRSLLPDVRRGLGPIHPAREFDPGFGVRYFSISEPDFQSEAGMPAAVLCHMTRSQDGGPLVFLKACVGERVNEIRTLASKLLQIADDAEQLERDTRFVRCFRRY